MPLYTTLLHSTVIHHLFQIVKDHSEKVWLFIEGWKLSKLLLQYAHATLSNFRDLPRVETQKHTIIWFLTSRLKLKITGRSTWAFRRAAVVSWRSSEGGGSASAHQSGRLPGARESQQEDRWNSVRAVRHVERLQTFYYPRGWCEFCVFFSAGYYLFKVPLLLVRKQIFSLILVATRCKLM